MSSRIEIELTSKLNENEWTWRKAGAKLPKGTVATTALYEGAAVGDVVRAEADFMLDGVEITSVAAPKARRTEKPVEKIDIKGSGQKFEGVTSQLVEKKGRGRSDRPDRGDRGDRGPRRDGDRRPPRGDRPERPGGERGGRPPREGGREGGRDGGRERTPRPSRPETPSFKRLTPKDTHRKAVLDQLPAESRPIAEQVLRGGIPAVRQAIEAENAKAKAEGRPEINSPALVSMAEELLPQLKAAEWQDRAEAAKAQVNEISIRDLRSVVTGADAVARTDEARLLAAELRDALERRTTEERDTWVKEIETNITEGRSIRALRLSSRPPDPQAKFPTELLDRLKTAAEETMSPETPADRWITLLDAVANSPVRRTVQPKGLPAEPGEALLSAAKQAAGRIPALAKMLGVTMPPPPRRAAPLPPKPEKSAPTGTLEAGEAGNEPAFQAGSEPEGTQAAAAPADKPSTES